MGPAVQTWRAIAVRTFFDGPEEHSQPHSIFVVLRAVDLQRTGHPQLILDGGGSAVSIRGWRPAAPLARMRASRESSAFRV